MKRGGGCEITVEAGQGLCRCERVTLDAVLAGNSSRSGHPPLALRPSDLTWRL